MGPTLSTPAIQVASSPCLVNLLLLVTVVVGQSVAAFLRGVNINNDSTVLNAASKKTSHLFDNGNINNNNGEFVDVTNVVQLRSDTSSTDCLNGQNLKANRLRKLKRKEAIDKCLHKHLYRGIRQLFIVS